MESLLMKTMSYMKLGTGFLLAFVLSGCNLAYYMQAISGQMDVFANQRPIDEVLQDPSTRQGLKDKLAFIQQVRVFSIKELHLPDNDSYRNFADLKRPYMVWNVFAAPELSLVPYESCFLFTGCLSYRGYFNKQDAEAFAQELTAQGYDVNVSGIPAYSTIGWFDDPLPSTVIHYLDEDLAGLVFHELAHQVVYVDGDTAFNESFATAVELEGSRRWMQQNGNNEGFEQYKIRKQRRNEFITLIMQTRTELDVLYKSDLENVQKKEKKGRILAALKQRYASLKKSWNGYKGFDNWMDRDLNNAHFISAGLYYEHVTAFLALLRQHNSDLEVFYAEVNKLGKMSKEQRERILRQLSEN